MTVDLRKLARDVNEAIITTVCGDCGHTLVHHWVKSLRVEDEQGRRRWCAMADCECRGGDSQ